MNKITEFIFDNYEDYRINYKNMTISAWSPKLDLIALGSINGDLCIYRLQMNLIWKVTIKNEGSILSICWHPDGNLLVVGFKSGLIQYYSITYPYCLYHIRLEQPIEYMKWIALSHNFELTDNTEFPYNTKNIFPLKEQIYKNSVYKEDIKRLEEILRLKLKFSILIGINGMSIFLLSRGIFNLGKISLEDRRTSSYDKLYNVNMSPNFDSISYVMKVFNENGEQAFRTFVINCEFIRENLCQISNVSSIFIDIVYLRLLIQKHMKEIEESWEDCLSHFERGIMEYSKKKQNIPNWSLRTDFMEMILFGCCNKEFWTILEESLSLCGVKNISSAVTKMSSHIINHCCPHMHYTLIKLLFHSTEMINLLQFPSEYGFLNLSKDNITDMSNACRSSLFKLIEFQILLSDNIDNLNLFFQWINNGIDNHLGETNSYHSFSFSQLSVIMDFVTNKLRVIKSQNNEISAYKIEILHQYLTDNDLSVPQLIDDNLLQNYIKMFSEDNSFYFLKEGNFPNVHAKSLSNMIRLFLPNAIDKICWKNDNSLIKNHSNPSGSYPITLGTFNCELEESDVIVVSESYIEDDDDNECVDVCAFYHPKVPVLIWIRNNFETVKSCVIHLDKLSSDDFHNIKLIKIQFYNKNTLFLLMSVEKENVIENSYLVVLSWNLIELKYIEKIREHTFEELINEYFTIFPTTENNWINLSDLLTAKTRELLPIDAVDMTISCKRQLALVFFGRSRERCRIFVLEDI